MGIKTVAIHSDVDASSVSIFALFESGPYFGSNRKKVKDVGFYLLAWKGTQLKKNTCLITHSCIKQNGSIIMSSICVLTLLFSRL